MKEPDIKIDSQPSTADELAIPRSDVIHSRSIGGELPYDTGYQSAMNGEDPDKNPYAEHSWKHSEWQLGWSVFHETDSWGKMMNNDIALIAVTTDGFVDGASFSGIWDDKFRQEAKHYGFEVREVDRAYAKKALFTNIAVNGSLLA